MTEKIIKITATKSKQYESVNEEKLDDVDDHPSQRYLKWTEVRIDAEYVHEFEEAEENQYSVVFSFNLKKKPQLQFSSKLVRNIST